MIKVKYKDVEYKLEEKDFLLVEAINNLAAEIQRSRIYGR
jgi:hypothetical protein